MNGLDMLNTAPGGAATGQAVAARPGDTAPDDPGGEAPRSFNALLATFGEPAAPADGSVRPAVPGFTTQPAAVLRQALQVTAEARPSEAAEAAVEFADSASSDKKTSDKNTSAMSDDLSLTDLAGGPPAPPAPGDAAPALQGVSPWTAAVSGAVGIMMPALAGS